MKHLTARNLPKLARPRERLHVVPGPYTRLAHYRKRSGMTQDEAARAVGSSREHYGRLERGDADMHETMEHRIAFALDISIDERAHAFGLPGGSPSSTQPSKPALAFSRGARA